jgi:small subunit ribosomal protein S16
MVVIRLARTGAKKNPFYHIVVTDSRKARDGRFVERLGYFNPQARGKDIRIKFDQERVEYWVAQGAQPSDRVSSLISNYKKSPEKAQQGKESKSVFKQMQVKASKIALKEQLAQAASEEPATTDADPE